MIPLIDADILLYEIGYAAQTGWKYICEERGEEYDIPPFDYVECLLIQRIEEICQAVGATKPPRLFLSGKNNFRDKIATVKPYKGNRDESKKPFHYRNIRVYLEGVYFAETVEGIEADDALAITQCKALNKGETNTIICTRDKDLRQVPGWHYGWELGRQAEYGPVYVDEPGSIELVDKSIRGTGTAFFYSQCITGDSTDNIPGIPRKGAIAAYKALSWCKDLDEMLSSVREQYRATYADKGDEMLLEQGRLLWMVREMKDGKPVMWEMF